MTILFILLWFAIAYEIVNLVWIPTRVGKTVHVDGGLAAASALVGLIRAGFFVLLLVVLTNLTY